LYTIDGKEVRNDIIGMLDRNFLPRFRWSDDSTKRCRKELIKLFWEENRVLELPDDPEEQIAFVERKITRFVTKLQVLDDWEMSQDN
jgi:hypothetical protein